METQIVTTEEKSPVVVENVSDACFKASDIRARLKAKGLKGNALTKAVNEELAGLQAYADATVGALRRQHYNCTRLTQNARGEILMTWTPPKAEKASTAKDEEIANLKAEIERLKKLSEAQGVKFVEAGE